MIRSGDTLQNPVTGEMVHVVRSASETEGEYVLVDVRVEPDGFVAAAHIHPYQTEVFEIFEGEVGFKAGGKTIIAGPGEKGRRRARNRAPLLEQRGDRRSLPVRGASRAPVRGVARDDVRARRRRQDEP